MYQIEIPKELRPDLRSIIARNANKLHWPYQDLRFVMLVYYRYIKRLYPGETPEELTDKDINCGQCRVTAITQVKIQMAKHDQEPKTTGDK